MNQVAASPQSVAPELLAPEKLRLFLDKLDESIHKFGTELGIRSMEDVKYIEEKFQLSSFFSCFSSHANICFSLIT
jgi:hypothetical protein